MEWKKKIYEHAVKELNIDTAKDREAAYILSKMICSYSSSLDEVKLILSKFKTAIVLGAGPSLEQDVENAARLGIIDKAGIIAADGAACLLLKYNITPHAVVSDLDGPRDCLLKASELGSFIFVHAHGDNIALIREIVPLLLRGKILGTTQVEEIACLYNFGGFTDGDRAVLLCETLGVDRIILAGMDFGFEIGKYSKSGELTSKELVRKRKKLRIGKMVLEEFAKNSKVELYDATSGSGGIKGFKKITWERTKELVE
ncbi:MAG TPA: DUF115 domain-containing protein [Candidatus Caldiarchaeum subterraneum]|uniref:6-hydroxymethyl-7,8-dihydropterin pyrophosphokinase n=1 Tax=Caldiarchaeum subterraneum TaxID=311458 RepID=A0A832ZXF5_CALS0|nr:DUF115 domain-containing protein [Candidatus Caldarchaeum subterraneum]